MKNKKQRTVPTPTEAQFTALNDAYKYFNRKLFGGKLPGCILNFSRKKNTHGFLAPNRWRRVGETNYSIHEISLTPITLYRTPKEIFSTLVHEQAHLWQVEFGNPSRGGYHNREWADKMEQIGLMPSDTGKPGGKKTGQRMTHYIILRGRYERAFDKMPKKYVLPFTSLEGDLMASLLSATPTTKGGTDGSQSKQGQNQATKSRNKTKYTCPTCKVNVWGRPSLKLKCCECDEMFK